MIFALVKIKSETRVGVDYHFEKTEDEDRNIIWLAEKTKYFIRLMKPGYGIKGDYGNGAAYLHDSNNLKMVTPWCLYESPLLNEFKKTCVPVDK